MARGGCSTAAAGKCARRWEHRRGRWQRNPSPPRGGVVDPRFHGGLAINIRSSRTVTGKGVPSWWRHGAAKPTYYSHDRLRQGPGEPLRGYVQRFRWMQRKILELPAASVITVFYENVRSVSIREKLVARWVHTAAQLYSFAHRCARAEEAGIPPRADGRGRDGEEPKKKEPFVMKVTFNEDGSRSVIIGADLSKE